MGIYKDKHLIIDPYLSLQGLIDPVNLKKQTQIKINPYLPLKGPMDPKKLQKKF